MAKSYGRIYQNKSNVSITPFDIYNLYPVGSIYMSVNSTNPSNYFGGIWEQIKDRFLLACGDIYSNGATGGEATHKLTLDEMPRHQPQALLNTGDSNIHGSGINWQVVYNGRFYGGDMIKTYGGDKAHNNMPPYLAVYIWKRVA